MIVACDFIFFKYFLSVSFSFADFYFLDLFLNRMQFYLRWQMLINLTINI